MQLVAHFLSLFFFKFLNHTKEDKNNQHFYFIHINFLFFTWMYYITHFFFLHIPTNQSVRADQRDKKAEWF